MTNEKRRDPGVSPLVHFREGSAKGAPFSEAGIFGAHALATATGGFGNLLAELDRGLHVVTTTLQLTQDAFTGHFALEVLDGTLDAFVADLDLERPALN